MRRRKGKATAILVDSTISVHYITILHQLRSLVEERMGQIKIAKITILQENAHEFTKEISQEGFLPVIVHNDLDVHFAIEAMELVYNEKIQILVFVTENEDFLPLFIRARELGKDLYLITVGDASSGLQNAADQVIHLKSS